MFFTQQEEIQCNNQNAMLPSVLGHQLPQATTWPALSQAATCQPCRDAGSLSHAVVTTFTTKIQDSIDVSTHLAPLAMQLPQGVLCAAAASAPHCQQAAVQYRRPQHAAPGTWDRHRPHTAWCN
jgi:NADH:ubiquinone oxidoreductase subunit F (NADH-binding)